MRKGDRLNVWMNGSHVGVFTSLKRGVAFEYDWNAPRISFSLPKDGEWREDAPENFLEITPGIRCRQVCHDAGSRREISGILRLAGKRGFSWCAGVLSER